MARTHETQPQPLDHAWLEDFLERWEAAWNSHEPDRLLELMTEDIVYDDSAWPTTMRGHTAVREFLEFVWRGSPDMRFTLTEGPYIVPGEPKAAFSWTGTGTHTGPIDPPGFALESFDAVGRFRTVDSGKVVNTSGVMSSQRDIDGPFASGSEFLDRLATSADVKRCFAQHYLSFAVARPLADQDVCALSRVADGFGTSGDLKQLVVAVASSDAFRLRATEAPGAQP